MKPPSSITPELRNVIELQSRSSLPLSQQKEIEALFLKGDDQVREAYRCAWQYHSRPEQQAPEGSWRYGLILAGRGFGKTRAGAEWVRAQVQLGRKRIALVAPTTADARDVMVEGESGLLNVCAADERPVFQPSRRRLVWPNGAKAFLYSAQEPERLRGPQHDAAWADELAAWANLQAVWDQLQFGLRVGPAWWPPPRPSPCR